MALADFHYARGWRDGPFETEMAELKQAYQLYPFQRRFREGPALRVVVKIRRGK